MNDAPGGRPLPQPIGRDVPHSEVDRLLQTILDRTPEMLLYDGGEDHPVRLVRSNRMGPSLYALTLAGLAEERLEGWVADQRKLILRAHLFDGGLYKQISALVECARGVDAHGTPALDVLLMSRLKRVSNILLSTTTHEGEPALLKISIEGAPPEVRLLPGTVEQLQPWMARRHILAPSAASRDGRAVHLFDLSRLNGELPEAAPAPAASSFAAEAAPRYALLEQGLGELGRSLQTLLEENGWRTGDFDPSAPLPGETTAEAELLVMTTNGSEIHPVDRLHRLIQQGEARSFNVVFVGETLSQAREAEWNQVGRGIFLRETTPERYARQKLERFLAALPRKGRQQHELNREQPLLLMVDDEPAYLDAAGSLLARHNCRVVTAHNGEEGIRLARDLMPDLILLDNEMPGINGLDVLRTLRYFRGTRSVPVIMVSAVKESRRINNAVRIGISDYILKPFRDDDLLQRVWHALGHGAPVLEETPTA